MPYPNLYALGSKTPTHQTCHFAYNEKDLTDALILADDRSRGSRPGKCDGENVSTPERKLVALQTLTGFTGSSVYTLLTGLTSALAEHAVACPFVSYSGSALYPST